MTAPTVHVVGASGRSGLALCQALLAEGSAIVPVVRNLAKWRAAGVSGEARVADLGDAGGLRLALSDATRIASCAHARHTAAILAASAPDARVVLLGSTRRYTAWPDSHGAGVLAGETALLGSGRAGIMLHPTMIYGAEGEDNVQRLARLLRRLPFVPLPNGGTALVQPIYQDDVTRCIIAALGVSWEAPRTLVIAGPQPVSYAGFVASVARAAGIRRPRIVSLPARLLIALAPFSAAIPFFPTIGAAEVRRLLEDKAFDVGPMIAALGVRPMGLEAGLARIWPGSGP